MGKLVLSRDEGQVLCISRSVGEGQYETINIRVEQVRSCRTVRMSIDAPTNYVVYREELGEKYGIAEIDSNRKHR